MDVTGTVDMTGRVCLITGATAGIGEATAHALADMGATILVHGRDQARCDAVVTALRERTGNAAHLAVIGDLASLAAVRALAADIQQRTTRLHVLLNNAGAMFPTRRETVDGHEATFAVNHLAPFLLTNLLLDLLRSSAPSRVITVASGAHRRAVVDFENLQSRVDYEGREVYGRSKLLNVVFNCELARRLEGTGVTANVLSPGLVHTEFGLKDGYGADQQEIMNRGATPEHGARTSVYLASSPEVAVVSGGYFVDATPAEPGAGAQDDAVAQQLWELSALLVRR